MVHTHFGAEDSGVPIPSTSALPPSPISPPRHEKRKSPIKSQQNGSLSPAKRVRLNDSQEEDHGKEKQKTAKDRKDKSAALLNARMQLPIWQGKEAITQAVAENDTIVILGETGSGKTTQVPQFLQSSSTRVCIAQPRRVAAISLATRVAQEVGCKLGKEVGYTVRFDDMSDPQRTKCKFVTDGTLLQELLADELLDRYDVVIVDEAHERTLRTDMVLGFLKKVQRLRKARKEEGKTELKIIVMSATLDAERFSEFFDGAKILYVKGRQYKVKVQYAAEAQTDYLDAALRTFFVTHVEQPPGDVLIFLTGEEEIESISSSIGFFSQNLKPHHSKIMICPLYAKLPPAQQAKAFGPTPPGTRKVILSTNVAETSVTIPGVKYVIDCGMMKEKSYHAVNGMDSLLVKPISKSSAMQRTGRAGRETNGVCYRLYREQDFLGLPQSQVPEIQRCSLQFALLHLLASGQENVFTFEFMDPPDREAMTEAMLHLYALGAVDNKQGISAIGRQMASFPLEPTSARTLIASFEIGCPHEVISLVSLLSYSDNLLMTSANIREQAQEAHAKFVHRDGDHLTLFNVLAAYDAACETAQSRSERAEWCKDNYVNVKTMANVLEARKQLRERCDRLGLDWKVSCGDDLSQVLEACMAGFHQNTALRWPDNKYQKTIGRLPVKIHPSSVLHMKKAQAVMYHELILTSQTYIRTVSSIPAHWITSKAPRLFGQAAMKQSQVTNGTH